MPVLVWYACHPLFDLTQLYVSLLALWHVPDYVTPWPHMQS